MLPDEDTGVPSLERKERFSACPIGSPGKGEAENERVLPRRTWRMPLPAGNKDRLFLTRLPCFDLAHCLVQFLG